MTEQINVWFLREVASEDCFAEDLRDQCSQVRANMEKMMLELERLRGRGATLDCLDRLRLMQNVEKRRMLLEARVGTHERELVWPYGFEWCFIGFKGVCIGAVSQL
ncbi:hypothetical protein Tco_0895697 [Tanacetum coccineum]|uniref:Uncharacterized protein n=1 Tax=Tanacetum coccineum TaxID=301880 RepID=A0ABQ5CFP6_9ASTR